MMIGYLRLALDVYGPEHDKGRRLWILYDETGFDVAVGDCVHCTQVAWERSIAILTIH